MSRPITEEMTMLSTFSDFMGQWHSVASLPRDIEYTFSLLSVSSWQLMYVTMSIADDHRGTQWLYAVYVLWLQGQGRTVVLSPRDTESTFSLFFFFFFSFLFFFFFSFIPPPPFFSPSFPPPFFFTPFFFLSFLFFFLRDNVLDNVHRRRGTDSVLSTFSDFRDRDIRWRHCLETLSILSVLFLCSWPDNAWPGRSSRSCYCLWCCRPWSFKGRSRSLRSGRTDSLRTHPGWRGWLNDGPLTYTLPRGAAWPLSMIIIMRPTQHNTANSKHWFTTSFLQPLL